jgi:hypothetical protein
LPGDRKEKLKVAAEETVTRDTTADP